MALVNGLQAHAFFFGNFGLGSALIIVLFQHAAVAGLQAAQSSGEPFLAVAFFFSLDIIGLEVDFFVGYDFCEGQAFSSGDWVVKGFIGLYGMVKLTALPLFVILAQVHLDEGVESRAPPGVKLFQAFHKGDHAVLEGVLKLAVLNA